MKKKRLVRIEINGNCNLRCPMCPQSVQAGKKNYMSSKVLKGILDKAKQHLATQEVHVHLGGEPLLHPQVASMIQLVKKEGLKPVLVTNATLLTASKAQKLIQAGLYKICFSFEGFDKTSFESIRVGANYEKTYQNILRFLELNPDPTSSEHVITELRIVDLPDVPSKVKTRFISNFGSYFDYVKTMPYVSWMGEVQAPKDLQQRTYYGCSAPTDSLNVLSDGRVVACCFDVQGKMVLGNLIEQSWDEIQNGSALKELQDRLDRGDLEGLPCENCEKPWTDQSGVTSIETANG